MGVAQCFGRYEVVRRLGHGGMAEVFEGRHIDLGTRVAIKVLYPTAVTRDDAIRRILREGRAAAAIRHPHVVAMLDVGMAATPFLVMELLEGEDLSTRLARQGPLGLEEAVDLVIPIAAGVAAAHDAGVLHRDLKPSNVLLARRHCGIEPVVVDFGISRQEHWNSDSEKSSRSAGTPQYMAPEVLRRADAVSPRSDQYSLAVLLYECVVGGTPFWSEDRYELLHSIMTAEVVPPRQLNPLLPSAFDAIVLRALARDPASRFPNARAFAVALLPFASAGLRGKWSTELGDGGALSSGLVLRARPGSASRSNSPWLRRAAAIIAAGLLLEVGIVAGSGASVRHGDEASAGAPAPTPSWPTAMPSGNDEPPNPLPVVSMTQAPPADPPLVVACTMRAEDAAGHAGSALASVPPRGRSASHAAGTAAPRANSSSHLESAPTPAPISTVLERGTANVLILE